VGVIYELAPPGEALWDPEAEGEMPATEPEEATP
jgi:hypothetical protein